MRFVQGQKESSPRPGSQMTPLTASCRSRWTPPTSHIKTSWSIIIAVNCRSGKKPITSRLCLLVNAANKQLLSVCHRKHNCKQTLRSHVFILDGNCYILGFLSKLPCAPWTSGKWLTYCSESDESGSPCLMRESSCNSNNLTCFICRWY